MYFEKIARAVYDIEEATSTAYDIILEQKVDIFPSHFVLIFCISVSIISSHLLCAFWQMIKSETRASLIKFLQILVVHHPSRRSTPTLLVWTFDLQNVLLCSLINTLFLLGAGREVQRYLWTLMICAHQTWGLPINRKPPMVMARVH